MITHNNYFAIKALRILHAYKVYPPHKGGIPIIIKQIAEGLNSVSHQEVLCTQAKLLGHTEIINTIPIKRLSSFGQLLSLPITPHFPVALWRAAPQFDIVDYHFPMPWVDISVATYWPAQTKLVIHWHSQIVRQIKSMKFLEPLIRRCLHKASAIVVADEVYITQSSLLGEFKEKCIIIPYGIRSEDWRTLNENEQQKITEIHREYKRIILATGRLVPYKGFSVLICAMQSILPDCKLFIVGRGRLEHELRLLVKKLKLEDRIYFFNKVDRSTLKCFYHAAELFVLPSIEESESFGMVQLEAMSCAKPIINTDLNSAVPKVARHGIEAITVTKNSSEALADAVNKILSNANLAQTLGQQGLQRVQNEYSEQKFLEATLALYQRCTQ